AGAYSLRRRERIRALLAPVLPEPFTARPGLVPGAFHKEISMKKLLFVSLASAGMLALGACGSADDASVDAEADTVEMPAAEAMTDGVEDPVADEAATEDAAEATAEATEEAVGAAEAASEAAADAAAAAAEAADAAEAAE